MGQTHNRKRTRSRPRSRNPNYLRDFSSMSAPYSYSMPPPPPSSATVSTLPTLPPRPHRSSSIYSTTSSSWSDQTISPLDTNPISMGTEFRPTPTAPRAYYRQNAPTTTISKRRQRKESGDPAVESAAKRKRIFGSDTGDEEGELCGPMLKVVWDLFEGYDYEDTY